MNSRYLFLSLLLATATLTGCVGTDIGNPEQDSEVTLDYEGYESEDPGALVLDSGITLEAAWIVVEAVQLSEVDGGCTPPDNPDVQGPLVVELLTRREHPNTPVFTRLATDYCGLELRLTTATADILPADAPPELVGQSVLLSGLRADNLPFTLLADFNDSLSLSPNGDSFSLLPERDHLILAFDLRGWIDASLLDGLLNLLGPITDATAPDLIAGLRASLTGSIHLYRDSNDNGILDPQELAAAPLASSP